MFYQIKNNSIKKNNQIRVASPSAIFKAIKTANWKATDCSITELQSELVTAKYKGADGKNMAV